MNYDYDRRRGIVAADATAARPKPKRPVVVRHEQDQVIKALVEAHYLIQEWVIRANRASDPKVQETGFFAEWQSSPQEYEQLAKLRDELTEFTDKIRHLRSG